MGGSSSKPEIRTVVQEIVKIDECRPPIMDYAMEHTQDASRMFEDCARQAASKLYMEMMNHNQAVNRETLETLGNIGQKMKENSRKDAQFCYNIEKKYKPFGIEAPVGLDCNQFEDFKVGCRLKNPNNYDASCETGKKLSPPPPQEKDKDGNDVPNLLSLVIQESENHTMAMD